VGRVAPDAIAPQALTVNRRTAGYLFGVRPEIDIWRVANLMINRYGDAAVAESAKRAEELADDGDLAGVAVWLRVLDAVRQLAITTPIGTVHRTLLSPHGGGSSRIAVHQSRCTLIVPK
jgi:hypothetical protein